MIYKKITQLGDSSKLQAEKKYSNSMCSSSFKYSSSAENQIGFRLAPELSSIIQVQIKSNYTIYYQSIAIWVTNHFTYKSEICISKQ